ncbi:MAG: sporulation protein YqfD [Clostridia bacterium]|nr:sporulation protein YqfD [Clostridia bacterium]
MQNPIIFLFGYNTITADLSYAAKILNLCGFYGIPYRNQSCNNDKISLECSLFGTARLLRLCRKNGIDVISVTPHGLPHLIFSYRRRYGLLIGLILATALVFLSGRVLWDVRIDGEVRLSEKEVIDELRACGLYVGMPLDKIDADVIQNRVMIYSDDVSWISINLSGTVAHVEIRESTKLPEEEKSPSVANLVAAKDGKIAGFEEVRGDITVKIGDFVREGDLLVSGIRDSKTLGFTYTAAEGKVFAEVVDEYEVDIPLEYEKKEYLGNAYCEKYIVFFGKEIKIYSNIKKKTESCDIIDTVEYANVLSLGELPFGIRTVRYIPYEFKTAKRSENEAIDLAFYKLRLIEEEKGICDILKKELSGEFLGGAYKLRSKTTSQKNIARQVEIEING